MHLHLTRVFGIVPMLIAFLAGPAVAQPPSHLDSTGIKPIEIRLVAQEASGGAPVAGRDRTFELEPETLLGPSDFASVGEVEWVEGKPGFNVALTPAGAEKYERISTENVGRTLAIVVDGKIVMAPKILDPVRARGFLLTVNSEAEARALAAKVRQAVAPD